MGVTVISPRVFPMSELIEIAFPSGTVIVPKADTVQLPDRACITMFVGLAITVS